MFQFNSASFKSRNLIRSLKKQRDILEVHLPLFVFKMLA